jgi:hypothetical protein
MGLRRPLQNLEAAFDLGCDDARMTDGRYTIDQDFDQQL